ncbi:NAD(P)-dependent oxidoreductase [Mesobaculum littorinae]|uniref:NAD(P)-dependent oxidoreductase n=1 Tax=Mesobaculum littorinae TaxID=2486419 RepID=A0A438AIK7_9RHOB|nr:NAD(P)-dependent oxidoreductase [Mesobaculum littorinae]RVV98478.1 NAD(P)-dependent oxidoreductase [Mesobaculum littorinae]
MRVFFTGGSGKAGRHVVPYLAAQGHHVVNFDRVPLGAPGVDDIAGDVTDAGEVFGAMTSYGNLGELEAGSGVPRFDAVVHFAAVPRILLTTDGTCFRVNTQGTYNVIEAAVKLGIRKIIIASSETTYGICFADGERRPEYLPIDEEHPTVPEDSYAMSKVCNEATARSFQARSGFDIYALRINNVIEPHEYARDFPAYVEDASLRRRNIFAYIDARDLGQIVDLCLSNSGLGYQVFNAANDHHSVALSTQEIAERFYPGVPFRREMGPRETFYSNAKIRDMLGFRQEHDWRDILQD